jgi:glycosyltransferase involved in cell wall biosynthesis
VTTSRSTDTASAPHPARRAGIVVPTLAGGGAERIARVWAAGLASRGHDVVLLTAASDSNQLVPDLPVVNWVGDGRADRWLRWHRWLAGVAAERRLDALIGVLTVSNLAVLRAISRRSPTATVISEHNVASVLLRQEGPRGAAKRLAARRLYRRADIALAVSHPVATDLVVGFGVDAARVRVVRNPTLRSHGPLDRRTSGDGRLVFVGRLVRQKCPERMIDLAAELARRGTPVAVQFIGGGPQEGLVRGAASAAGVSIAIEPWVEDWTAVAAGASCLVLPSDVEGYGNVLAEAAEIGLPVVAPSTSLGVADAILPGVSGVLAATPRAGDLADAVARARELDMERGAATVATWLSEAAPERIAEQLEAAIEDALETASVRAVSRRRLS